MMDSAPGRAIGEIAVRPAYAPSDCTVWGLSLVLRPLAPYGRGTVLASALRATLSAPVELAGGALLLFATNWLAIVLAAGIVFALVGFGAHRGARGRFEGGLAAAGLMALLIVLVIPLGLNAVERWGDSAKNREASEVVREWDATLAVENLVVDTTVEPTQVRLQVSGQSAPDSTDELAQLLADRLEEPVFLRIRFRPEFSAGSVALDE